MIPKGSILLFENDHQRKTKLLTLNHHITRRVDSSLSITLGMLEIKYICDLHTYVHV